MGSEGRRSFQTIPCTLKVPKGSQAGLCGLVVVLRSLRGAGYRSGSLRNG